MGRNLWTTRLLPLHLGMVVSVLACLLLGYWQYSRASDERRGPLLERPGPAVPLTDVLTPGQPLPPAGVGQAVTASGAYLEGQQLLLPDRESAGRRGYWLSAVLRLDSGELATVVRGWVPTPDDPRAALPSGQVAITGRVQPAEPVDDALDADLPEGQASAASPVEFLDRVDGEMYAALVVAETESAERPDVAAPEPAEVWIRQTGGGGWRNLAYALQWVLFAGFAVFMWWRWLPREPEDGQESMDPVAPDGIADPVETVK